MSIISVCVCTRRRPEGLKRLLKSFNNMKNPEGITLKIIVVENDFESKSKKIVENFSNLGNFQINYYLEPEQGISIARNRAVKESHNTDFCCFVDDDQEVAPDWLEELLKCQQEFNSDGVWGQNPPVFNRSVPLYIEKFYQPEVFPYGTIVRTAHTNCLMLRKKCLDRIIGPFDERLNFTGGEDSYLTSKISAIGFIIRFNPRAIAYEIIPGERTTIKYILRRTLRISNAGFIIKSFQKESFRKTEEFTRLLLRFGFGMLILIPYLVFSKEDKIKGWIKIANSVGGFSYFFGRSNNFYK